MINYLTAKTLLKNVVLVFDGFMILKDDIKVPINEFMADLEKHVKTITGYEIKLSSKKWIKIFKYLMI
jgi:hypothetical protein